MKATKDGWLVNSTKSLRVKPGVCAISYNWEFIRVIKGVVFFNKAQMNVTTSGHQSIGRGYFPMAEVEFRTGEALQSFSDSTYLRWVKEALKSELGATELTLEQKSKNPRVRPATLDGLRAEVSQIKGYLQKVEELIEEFKMEEA